MTESDGVGGPGPSEPVLPDYDGACTANVVEPLVEDPDSVPDWFPEGVVGADQIVLLVLDGLGWHQMRERVHLLRGLSSMSAVPITTVAPSTTATALTSISTGLPPGEHGVIGYRMAVDNDVLNVLRWTTSKGDARESIPPESIQHEVAFGGQRPPVVVRAEFRDSGFTRTHLGGCRHVPYRMPSTLVAEIMHQLERGEPFVYAYYDGIDKVAHEYGLDFFYDAELVFVDRMVEYLIETLPAGTALVITADHGQVDVGGRVFPPDPEVLSHVQRQSGEGRFRWLHAAPGRELALFESARQHHSDTAWVVTRDQCLDECWFGPKVLPAAASRLGDVALVAREDVAFEDPADTGPFKLIGRHGSVTDAEMRVPLPGRPTLNLGADPGVVIIAAMSFPASPSSPGADAAVDQTDPREILSPDQVSSAVEGAPEPEVASEEAGEGADIESPGKIIRVGSMVKQLLEEVRNTELDDAARGQLRRIYENSLAQLRSALSPELGEELTDLSFDFSDEAAPTDAELRMAKAQLVGWLEGLFHGIQATLVAQQMSARQQLEGMRGQIPERAGPGVPGGPGYI